MYNFIWKYIPLLLPTVLELPSSDKIWALTWKSLGCSLLKSSLMATKTDKQDSERLKKKIKQMKIIRDLNINKSRVLDYLWLSIPAMLRYTE